MQIKHLQHLRARFEPKRLDTLRPEARPFVGQTFGWVPEEDLVFEEEGTT